jgi:type I restriction enzyme S subunit
MLYGLKQAHIDAICRCFAAIPTIREVVIYGSRAKGTYKPGSDIDLTMIDDEISSSDLVHLENALDDLMLPYKFDLSLKRKIKNPDLIEHINRAGKIFYQRAANKSEWKECRLGNLINYINRGITPKYGDAKGIPIINQKCIRNGKIIDDFMKYHDCNSLYTNEKELQINDILINSTGVGTVGRVAIFNKGGRYLADSHVTILRVNNSKIHPNFLFFNLRGRENEIENYAEGSTGQVELGREKLKEIDIILPPLPEQRAIASVLSSLDDKIDLLHRQNTTLEKMAETLFRKWFVEDGKEEWEETIIGNVTTIKGGTTPNTKEAKFWDGNIYWSTPKDLSNQQYVFLFDTERKITKEGLEQIGSGLLPKGTVLLSSRAPIGYLAIAGVPVAINQGYIAIICDAEISNYFMYLWCKHNMEEIQNAGNGSVFQEISKSVFKHLPITVSPIELLRKFDKTIESHFEKIKINQAQIRTLTTLRDTLLSKLMSGEVKLKI